MWFCIKQEYKTYEDVTKYAIRRKRYMQYEAKPALNGEQFEKACEQLESLYDWFVHEIPYHNKSDKGYVGEVYRSPGTTVIFIEYPEGYTDLSVRAWRFYVGEIYRSWQSYWEKCKEER